MITSPAFTPAFSAAESFETDRTRTPVLHAEVLRQLRAQRLGLDRRAIRSARTCSRAGCRGSCWSLQLELLHLPLDLVCIARSCSTLEGSPNTAVPFLAAIVAVRVWVEPSRLTSSRACLPSGVSRTMRTNCSVPSTRWPLYSSTTSPDLQPGLGGRAVVLHPGDLDATLFLQLQGLGPIRVDISDAHSQEATAPRRDHAHLRRDAEVDFLGAHISNQSQPGHQRSRNCESHIASKPALTAIRVRRPQPAECHHQNASMRSVHLLERPLDTLPDVAIPFSLDGLLEHSRRAPAICAPRAGRWPGHELRRCRRRAARWRGSTGLPDRRRRASGPRWPSAARPRWDRCWIA